MTKKIPLIGFGVCLAALLFFLLYLRPFWGIQDDGNYLKDAQYFRDIGLWAATKEIFLADLKWGMVRPYLPTFIVFMYGWSAETNLYTHFLNIFWVIGGHGFFFWAFLRSPIGREYFPPGKVAANSLIAFLLLLTLLIPWTHWYFLIPAMQEKIVLLWATLSLLALSHPKVNRASFLPFAWVSLVIATTGAITKPQYLLFGPMLVACLWRAEEKFPWAKAIYLFFVFCLGAVALKLVASQGNYTDAYTLEAVRETLKQPKPLFAMFGLSLLHGLALGYLGFRRKLNIRQIFLFASPALCLVAFVTIMLPWKLGGYLNSQIVPLLSLIVAFWIFRLVRRQWQFSTIFLAVSLGALVVTSWKANRQWGPLASLRFLVEETKKGHWPKEANLVWNSCEEGHAHLEFYLRKFGGQQNLEVKFAPSGELPRLAREVTGNRIYWLAHPDWCPVTPNESIFHLSPPQILLGLDEPRSFQLLSYQRTENKP